MLPRMMWVSMLNLAFVAVAYCAPARQIAEFNEEAEVAALEFSPDGAHLATVGRLASEVHVWRWEKKQIERRLHIPEGSALSTSQGGLRYSSDGRLLAIAHDQDKSDSYSVVQVWDTHTGSLVHSLMEQHRNGLRGCIDFSPKGSFFARTYDAPAHFPGDQFFMYDTISWRELWSLHTAPFIPVTMALSPNGKWAAMGGGVLEDSTHAHSEIAVIDLERRSIVRRLKVLQSNQTIQLVRWSSDSSGIAVAASPGASAPHEATLLVIDEASGGEQDVEYGETGVTSLSFTPDGKYLVESGKHARVKIWDARHTKLLQSIPIASGRFALSRDGHRLAIAALQTVSVWQLD